MDDLLLVVFCVFFFCGLFVIAVFCLVMAIRQYPEMKKKAKESRPAREPEYSGEELNATVIDQYCYVETVGIKTPKTVKIFTVAFETDDGRVLKLSVPEEMYDGFEKGQTGLLTMVDGELYGFALNNNQSDTQ